MSDSQLSDASRADVVNGKTGDRSSQTRHSIALRTDPSDVLTLAALHRWMFRESRQTLTTISQKRWSNVPRLQDEVNALLRGAWATGVLTGYDARIVYDMRADLLGATESWLVTATDQDLLAGIMLDATMVPGFRAVAAKNPNLTTATADAVTRELLSRIDVNATGWDKRTGSEAVAAVLNGAVVSADVLADVVEVWKRLWTGLDSTGVEPAWLMFLPGVDRQPYAQDIQDLLLACPTRAFARAQMLAQNPYATEQSVTAMVSTIVGKTLIKGKHPQQMELLGLLMWHPRLDAMTVADRLAKDKRMKVRDCVSNAIYMQINERVYQHEGVIPEDVAVRCGLLKLAVSPGRMDWTVQKILSAMSTDRLTQMASTGSDAEKVFASRMLLTAALGD